MITFEWSQNEVKELSKLYRPITVGNAEISVIPFNGGRMDRYLRDYFCTGGYSIPVLRINNKLFMSITYMEVESHVLATKWASGRVLNIGLGLGYYLQKILNKPDLTEVLCVESEQSVIDIYLELFGQHPKLKIIHDSIFNKTCIEKLRDEKFDFTYVDIWPEGNDIHVLNDMGDIREYVNSKTYSFWTLERACSRCDDNRDQLMEFIRNAMTQDMRNDLADFIEEYE